MTAHSCIIFLRITGPAPSPYTLFNCSDPFQIVTDENGCTTTLHTFNPLKHKPTYRFGVYNAEGDELTIQMYNLTFAEYLTETAGRKFDPPIQFEMVPVSMAELMNMAETEEVDFMFASSAVSSCMATEYEVQPLVTIINRRSSRGHLYELDQYGGVIFTLAGNDEVNVLEDIKDRTVGSGGSKLDGGSCLHVSMTRISHLWSCLLCSYRDGRCTDAVLRIVLAWNFLRGRSKADVIHQQRENNS